MRIVSVPKENVPLHPLSAVRGERTPNRELHPDRKVALPTMEGISFERINHIVCLEAKGNYTSLHFKDGRQILVCKTLREMEFVLKTDWQFVRVHRSYTINLHHLQKYVKGKGGYVVMENGNTINVSTGKKQHFMNALENYFHC